MKTPPLNSFPYEVRSELLVHARIPRAYWKSEISVQPLERFLQGWGGVVKNGIGLLLMGAHGVGKTWNACAVLRFALTHTSKVLFINAQDTVRCAVEKTKFDDDHTLEYALHDRDVLLIDDLGKEYRGSGTGYSEQYLDNLVRARSGQHRITMFTSNLDKDGLEGVYGPGFVSLLAECCVPLNISGKDRRRDRLETNLRRVK
jgi:DNA replication protein DnaC